MVKAHFAQCILKIIKMIDLGVKEFKYSNQTFNVSIDNFDKLTKAPIKIFNHKTNNERIFIFDSEEENIKVFKCDSLLLIVRKYG